MSSKRIYFCSTGEHKIKIKAVSKMKSSEARERLSDKAYDRMREAIVRLMGGDMEGLSEPLTCTAATVAIDEKVTAGEIETMRADRLKRQVVQWLKSQGIYLEDGEKPQPRKKAAAAKPMGGKARVTSSVAIATEHAKFSREIMEEASTTEIVGKPYSTAARVAMFLVARLLPMKNIEPPKPSQCFEADYQRLYLTNGQVSTLTKELFSDNEPDKRERLFGVLRELSRPIDSITRIKENGRLKSKRTVRNAKLISWHFVEEEERRDGKFKEDCALYIGVSGLFYANMRHHEDVEVRALLEGFHATHGAEYVAMRLWAAGEAAQIRAAQASTGTTKHFRYSLLPSWNDVGEEMRKKRRAACRAVADRAAHDIGAVSWREGKDDDGERGISFTWEKSKKEPGEEPKNG